MIYGNQTTITPAQETALVGFVEGGKGLVALHAASAMFTNSDKYTRARRRAVPTARHRRLHGRHRPAAASGDAGRQPFTTWDETYVHDKHNPPIARC